MKPQDIPATVEPWLFETALPFWADTGFDREQGSFAERLDLATAQAESPFKRVRVQARQIYVFSHAHMLGWNGGGLELAARAVDFIRQNGWIPARGWARVLSRNGEVVDDTLDLYDQAFVLYALGWFIRASGDTGCHELARQTLEAVRSNLRHPGGEGYMHAKPPTAPWLQNPHMHMLEAMISLAHATKEQIYFDEGRALAELFRTRFYDPATRTLAEYYDEHWRRMAGEQGRITEPGHQFEWAWLLYAFSDLCGEDFRTEALGLYDFAQAFGVNRKTGLSLDEVRDDGKVLSASVRTWPQTEALKANLAVMLHEGTDTRDKIVQNVRNLFDVFLDRPVKGAWIDHFESDRQTPKVKIVPASTLYHVFLAFSEIMRLKHLLLGTGR